jgi:hypothetical protein
VLVLSRITSRPCRSGTEARTPTRKLTFIKITPKENLTYLTHSSQSLHSPIHAWGSISNDL